MRADLWFAQEEQRRLRLLGPIDLHRQYASMPGSWPNLPPEPDPDEPEPTAEPEREAQRDAE